MSVIYWNELNDGNNLNLIQCHSLQELWRNNFKESYKALWATCPFTTNVEF